MRQIPRTRILRQTQRANNDQMVRSHMPRLHSRAPRRRVQKAMTHEPHFSDDLSMDELRLLHAAYERESTARDMAQHELYLYRQGRGSMMDLALALQELLDATA